MRNWHPLFLLAFLLACEGFFDLTNEEPEAAAATGSLVLGITTRGGDPDTNGYRIAIDGTDLGITVASTATLVRVVVVGPHVVELLDVAADCDVSDGVQRSVTVEQRASVRVAFQILCSATQRVPLRAPQPGVSAVPVPLNNPG